MNICYYHNDLDGIASASVVLKACADVKFIPVNYNSDWIEEDVEDSNIIIVDFTFNKMKELIDKCKSIVWIDHHKTAKDNNKKLWNDKKILGLRRLGKSGCELTWEWFFPKNKIPKSLSYIGDRDLWKFKLSKTESFCEVAKLKFEKPSENLLFNPDDNFFKDGEILLKKNKKQIIQSFSEGTNTIFEGHLTRVMNANFNVSKLGEYCYKDKKYPIAMIWSLRNGKLIISLRSNTVNVREIAEKYGGGGHDFASGFSISMTDFFKIIYSKN